MSTVGTQVLTNRWLPMDWGEYLSHLEKPTLQSAKGYYYQEHGRFEISPVGPSHGKDHVMASIAIKLFCVLKSIPITVLNNVSYRKTGRDECQPDLSAYVGAKANGVPAYGEFIDLDLYSVPD